MRYFRLWLACARNCLSRQMEYKVEFFAAWVNEIFFQGFNLLFFFVLLDVAGPILDWSLYELFVFLGTVFVIDGMMMTAVYDNVMKLPIYINRGELDFFLLKPVNVQFFASLRYVRPSTVMSTLGAVGIVIYGLANLPDVHVTLGGVLLWIALCMNGLLILYSTMFIFQTASFWLISSAGFSHGYFMFYNFIMRPDSIFKGATRFILTYVFPSIVVGSYPARAILDKALSPSMALWGFALGLGTLAASVGLFKLGLRRYESASS
jgi:ABC-2 type transport system permease protein